MKKIAFIDSSDQLVTYSSYIRKTYKWYMQIFFHFVCQVVVVNSLKLYKVYTDQKMNVINFKKKL